MRWVLGVVFAGALLAAAAGPAFACDPDWEWCGYSWDDIWYDPYWYEPTPYEPVYEPSWNWWDEPVYGPVYVPAPVYEPPPVYMPAPIYEPAPVFEPAPVPRLEPTVTYEPVLTYTPFVPYEPAPVYMPMEPSPVFVSAAPAPAWTDPVVWSSPGSDYLDAQVVSIPGPGPVAISADPDARRAELGLHWVTDVYVRDNVTTEGLVTTYSTTSAAMTAGTSARLVATVATGELSSFDALVFNGRTTRSDGRPVSGSVYENYVWNGSDWVFDKYVFFQDDSETAAIATPTTPMPAPAAGVPPVPAVESPLPGPLGATGSAPPAGAAFVAPRIEGVAPGEPSSIPGSQPARPRDVRAGIALAPQADPLGRIEVLRGRRVALWVRAVVDGSPARVIAWTLVSGDLDALGPVSGTGDDPLVARWSSVATTPYPIRILASVEVTGEGSWQVEAGIDVIVRSPALVQ